ncbi:uncharacterized protein BDZ99DRAFT_467320 [Mytilinidion resinicola]|uniref:Uncharacterized protein n=1 Tax=Mytilinidion resinicola TaxID=574789 RepID=A0A6A6Y7W6_9PEZI|nr:uncharacterized protein BDZ99DRAFT_467320 [Mytilinidion resinicola]KAF2804633.1 hypothetical protein BDZ99DRAFT_467320 [Mytilinidion resinicola]
MSHDVLRIPSKGDTMASTSTFRFFDLPPELRIMVYKNLVCETDRTDHGIFEDPYSVRNRVGKAAPSIKTQILTVS